MKLRKAARRLVSYMLSIALIISCVPLDTKAAAITSAYGGTNNKIVDAPTVNGWTDYFGAEVLNTAHAGGVWTDKSVFNTVDDYLNATNENEVKSTFGLTMDDEENHFLVALSAIASSKSVEGYSALPSDTILVLDLSASMITNQAVSAMVQAANSAITELQNLNANNRVGVVAYSGKGTQGNSETSSATVILPLGRYTAGLDENSNSAYLVSSWNSGKNDKRTGVKVANGVTGDVAEGVPNTFSTSNNKVASGGTYIQNGLYQAWQQFEAVKDTTITEGIQAGTTRVPIMVLLSDGAPTAATTNYTSIGTSDSGDGSNTYATAGMAFMTQLTASWVRDKMEGKYGRDALLYSLGLNVGSNEAAQSVLNPSGTTTTDALWTEFIGLADKTNKEMQVTIASRGNNKVERTISYVSPVSSDGWTEAYMTKYFPASNAEKLIEAFKDIVQQIIIQSLYYPTLVDSNIGINHDGFLEFEDYVGKYMEVKSIKGIQLGTKLYTGETLAKMIYEGGMGTEENPSDAGNNLVWSVQSRLGIDDVTVARELLNKAYSNGQLFYDPETKEFSNYIGWYGDAAGKYVAFWDGEKSSLETAPANAVYAIKSYGYYDAVGEGHRKTDMMYATIQVRTTLKDTATGKIDASKAGDVRIIGKLPAALIPLVEYDVKLNGMDVMNPSELNVKGADAPTRLIYEVGLSEEVDLLDLENTAKDAKDQNGNYVFYTNQWDQNEPFSYSTNKNTLAYFEPSEENEHYYYNADTLIYTNTSGTLYTGNSAPVYSQNNPYYHRNLIYTKSGNTVTASWNYEPISEYVLENTSDLAKNADGNWYVKKGTIHHYYGESTEKVANSTNTFDYSSKPFVHDPVVGATLGYHVDHFLGNNGKLTLDPYEGIKLTKTADDTIADREQAYSFIITSSDADFSAVCTLIKEDASGIRYESTITFVNGAAGVSLKHGETAYILGGSMVGKTFAVIEDIPDDAGYEVASVNGVEGVDGVDITVSANVINEAAFVNTKVVNGDVVINKTVNSTFADHQTKEFAFIVTIGGTAVTGTTYTALRSDGTGYTMTAGSDNRITLTHGQNVIIQNLPGGAVVKAVEEDYSAVGFTSLVDDDETTVQVGKTAYINYTNIYKADETIPPTNVSVSGVKRLNTESDWTGTFRFKLQKYVNGSYVDVGSAVSVDYSQEKGEKTFTFNLDNEVYTQTGSYSYRVIEVNDGAQGIVYDTTPSYFNVIVSDNGQGQLYVSEVTAGDGSIVTSTTQNNTTYWSADVTFVNEYKVNGAAEALIKIFKNVTGEFGVTIPASGFRFEMSTAYVSGADVSGSDAWYVSGGDAVISDATGEDGITEFSLIFDKDEDTLQPHYYILEEVDDGQSGVGYSTVKYLVRIDVDHNNAGSYTIGAIIRDENGQEIVSKNGTASNNGIAVVEIDSGINFTNTYTPDSVTLSPGLMGTKVLSGRAQDAEFTFELFETDNTFRVAADQQAIDTQTAPAAADGVASVFNFKDLTYDRTGTHYYVVREQIPAGVDNSKTLNGVTYDTAEYHITVTVTGDNATGKLAAEAVITKDGAVVKDIAFRNTYHAKEVTADILNGTKNLEGNIRKLQARAYQFELVQNGTVIQTVYNNAPTNNDYTAGFAFEALTFDKADVYYYTVREKLPDGLVNGKLHGVQYDTNVYDVIITVTDNGRGQLQANTEIKLNGQRADLVFTNRYDVESTSISFSGIKTLKGDALTKYTGEKAFKYQLYAASYDSASQSVVKGSLITSVTNNASGEFSFSGLEELKFDRIGAYRFIIQEYIPSDADPLMVYDTSVYYIEVDVTDDLQGSLKATPTIIKVDDKGNETTVTEIGFYNEYKPAPITVELTGTKNYNISLPAGIFGFELYQALVDANGTIYPVGDPVLEAVNDGNREFVFEEKMLVDELSGLQVMTSYLTFEQEGTYYFIVNEKLPDGVDSSNNTQNGITYDTSSYAVTVKVTEVDDATGRAVLTAELLVNGIKDGKITFTNSYADGITIGGSKTLTGKNMKDGDFTFELYSAFMDSTGNVTYATTPLDTAQNVGNTFTFDKITYDKQSDVKTHYYVVKEQIPAGADRSNTLDGITYDTSEYLVTVSVTEKGDGTLTITSGVTKKGNVVSNVNFTNKYTAPSVSLTKEQFVNNGTSTTGTITVNAGDVVTYTLTARNKGRAAADQLIITDVIPEGLKLVNGSITGNGSLGTDGKTITWIVNELEGADADGNPGMVTVSFKVTVPEVNQTTTWKNIASFVYDKDTEIVDDPSNPHDPDDPDSPDDPDNPEPSNPVEIKEEPKDDDDDDDDWEPTPEPTPVVPAVPPTGDNSKMGLWSAALGISLMGMLGMFAVTYEKKKRKS